MLNDQSNTAGSGDFSVSPAAFDEADAMIVDRILQERQRAARPILIGLCGPQGSGKSTTADRLQRILNDESCPAIAVSIDDFYLTAADRAMLAADVHPLLKTRGVPGTHDMDLCMATLNALMLTTGVVPVPVFDKLADTRSPTSEWRKVEAPFDVVILEGWCVGARAMAPASLVEPINDLERADDADGLWRKFVNSCLSGQYQALFAELHLRILLRAPDFSQVHRWRSEQEAGLLGQNSASGPGMDEAEILRFISHYQRLTCWIMEDEPADLVIDIDHDRRPLRWRHPGKHRAVAAR